jgi:hypothetical protein
LLPPVLRAQSLAPPGQGGTPDKDAPQQAAATPSDSITIPVGTPLTLQLVSDLYSATATVGDTVQFITLPLRINGLVAVPMGTDISGTVVRVRRHRGSQNGQVTVAFEKVDLPNGESGALRPSKARMAGRPAESSLKPWVNDTGAALAAGTMGIGPPVMVPLYLLTKGHEQVYPARSRTTVYFNRPLYLDRGALLKSQPPPYKGPAQVFFTDTSGRSNSDTLFCGEMRVGLLSPPLRLELNPGTYSFTTRPDWSEYYHHRKANRILEEKAERKLDEKIAKAERESELNAKPVQLEVHEDHQYWIEGNRRELFVKDPSEHQAEFDIVQADLRRIDMDYTSSGQQDSCPQPAKSSSPEESK